MTGNQQAAIEELALAIRLTREYVGADILPAVDGWAWYDALKRHAPHHVLPAIDGWACHGTPTLPTDGTDEHPELKRGTSDSAP